MVTNRSYYTLKPKKKSFGEQFLSFLTLPFKIPSWFVSVLVAPIVTRIMLNQGQTPEQRSLQVIQIDEEDRNVVVLINFKKKSRFKWFDDLLIQITGQGSTNHQQNDQEHVDSILAEIDKLMTGTSARPIKWSQVHLKDIESLDAKMRAYFYEGLDKKYGSQSYKTERTHHIEFFTLCTRDGAELDSVEVIASGEESKPISERKFVITSLPREQNYVNWLKDLNYTATRLGATAISFNYRGVDQSRGSIWTEQDMVEDVLAQVERLIELGVKPENICLDGKGIAGAISTLAAARLHKQQCKVKLNNESSFRSLPRLLFGYIAPELQTANWWNPLTHLRFIVAGLAYIICSPILWLGGWLINAAKAWNQIPTKDKMYSVIRDENHDVYDGVISDSFSSIASLVDEELHRITKKLHDNVQLTEKEKVFLTEFNETSLAKFKPRNSVDCPHYVPRSELVAELENQQPGTCHEHFLNRVKDKFAAKGMSTARATVDKQKDITEKQTSYNVEKPLILACSGGAGHISAAKGIINELQKKNPDVVISQHEALLYKLHPFTFAGFFIRLGIYVGSLPVIGHVVNKTANLFMIPTMPDYKIFWNQIGNIKHTETVSKDGNERGLQRPYVDVLLDLFPAGYEFTAYNNAAHLSLTVRDRSIMSAYKGYVEGHNHYLVFKHVLQHLISAAKQGTPYTQIISTQALSIKSICEAVSYYNNTFLPEYNSHHRTSYPMVSIAQYFTDLPSLGCAHFMDNLDELSYEHRQLIELYTVYMSEPIKAAYFGAKHGFKALHDIEPSQNPMVRSGFKQDTLSVYADLEKSHKLTYKAYTKNPETGYLVSKENEIREVKAGEKVASIMIGSLAANASVEYIEHLLNAGYEHIFVFGGANDEIANRIEQIIAKYSTNEQAQVRKKIICLGNQTDVEMAPIFTRSNCVVIRGGGLSVMEQMAMPLINDKVVLMHHEDNDANILTSGLSWEDSNTDRLITYLEEHDVFAIKTSPKLCKGALDSAKTFYTKPLNPEGAAENTYTRAQNDKSMPIVKKLQPLSAPGKQGFFSPGADVATGLTMALETQCQC